MTNEWQARNIRVIEEFRASGGNLSRPTLLLTTVGAKSGRTHTTPLNFSRDGERLFVIASKGGSPSHPDWYYNLLANPRVTVEVGSETFEASASVLEGEERRQAFDRQASNMPFFANYEKTTAREIPVVALERIT